MSSCYNLNKLVYIEPSLYSKEGAVIETLTVDTTIKQRSKYDNIKMILSEFKKILETQIEEDGNHTDINNHLFIQSNNTESVDILKTILSNEEETLNTITTNNNNYNKFKELLLNNKLIKEIINNFNNNNNYNNDTVYFKDIQLFITENPINLNWYLFTKNNLPSFLNQLGNNHSIITSTMVLCKSNQFNKVFINHQVGSADNIETIENKDWDQSSNKSVLEMIDMLRNHLYQGTFEIHVSIQQPPQKHQPTDEPKEKDDEFVKSFKEFCVKRKLKSILIELSKGVYGKQMMTSSHHSGDFHTVQLKAFQIAFELLLEGYHVSRVKIEILASCKGVPENDIKHKLLSPSNYFEFHIKLLIPNDKDINHNNNNNNINDNNPTIEGNNNLKLLKELMINHNGHLSRNSFKVHVEESYQERFVTLRMYSIGKETAMDRFESCKNDLVLNKFNIASSHREYSIYDSNIGLDSGWIE
ncbi:hypothetical protein DICPUDRAFT_149244 [Dictyostelium purpureum]|uniref:Uncharacterized protein n=1 Tax=Dictyostelium purpureum TaxID=5786 RepID=F0ZD68_DICPU|nr:uncharacterized protein DICPUDRAFT_149244 [Dictyostelium purpureum]EGC38127.1 hypothetical protein DICPUDRAFT_149244 [Dictyostelium purpureum]|eukprot:XP_003285341.1 hypothetical protein DICPUDRAFT_149244 [Dictyostelium purpureum]